MYRIIMVLFLLTQMNSGFANGDRQNISKCINEDRDFDEPNAGDNSLFSFFDIDADELYDHEVIY